MGQHADGYRPSQHAQGRRKEDAVRCNSDTGGDDVKPQGHCSSGLAHWQGDVKKAESEEEEPDRRDRIEIDLDGITDRAVIEAEKGGTGWEAPATAPWLEKSVARAGKAALARLLAACRGRAHRRGRDCWCDDLCRCAGGRIRKARTALAC